MYDLLSDITTVPVKADSLKRVHTGMNKVRISVGEHISEPSEVYIITGDTGNGYESYIVFFMIEPAFHVVYGYDKNPYDPAALSEMAINEAIDFVETMGSILEEVPWETMSPEQRSTWAGKEALYREPGTVEPGLLEIDDEIESAELLEVVEEEDLLEAGPETIEDADMAPAVEEGPEDGSAADEVFGIDESDEDPAVGDGFGQGAEVEDEPGEAGSAQDGVVVADGDFDALLKQAFLKPDVARKTVKGKKKTAPIEEVDEDAADEIWEEAAAEPGLVGEDAGEFEIEKEDVSPPEEEGEQEIEPADEKGEAGEQAAAPVVEESRDEPHGGPSAAGMEVPHNSALSRSPESADDKTLLSFVRFLSRF